MFHTKQKIKIPEIEFAYVMVNCEDVSLGCALDEIRSIEGVQFAYHTVGSYDIMIALQAGSTDELRDSINLKIRRVRGVTSSTTLMRKKSTKLMNK